MTQATLSHKSEASNRSTIGKVEDIEDILRCLPPVQLDMEHYFAAGVYARELLIPAGTMLTGKVHLRDQLNILTMGKITVTTDQGAVIVRAPHVFVSPAGTKRAAYAHTDCVWLTILATDLTDPEEIEKTFTVSTEQEYLDKETKCLS